MVICFCDSLRVFFEELSKILSDLIMLVFEIGGGNGFMLQSVDEAFQFQLCFIKLFRANFLLLVALDETDASFQLPVSVHELPNLHVVFKPELNFIQGGDGGRRVNSLVNNTQVANARSRVERLLHLLDLLLNLVQALVQFVRPGGHTGDRFLNFGVTLFALFLCLDLHHEAPELVLRHKVFLDGLGQRGRQVLLPDKVSNAFEHGLGITSLVRWGQLRQAVKRTYLCVEVCKLFSYGDQFLVKLADRGH